MNAKIRRLVFTSLFPFHLMIIYIRFRSSFICQVALTRRQRNDLFGLRVKLPPVLLLLV